MQSVAAQLGDPDGKKNEQSRLLAKQTLSRLKRQQDGSDGRGDESSESKDRWIDELELNEYENLVVRDVVAPFDIPVGFKGRSLSLASPQRLCSTAELSPAHA